MEVHPADDPFDPRLPLGQPQQPAGFLDRLPSLHGDGTVQLEPGEFARQVGGAEIPAQALHLVADPRILPRVVLPEMLMRVDSHRFTFARNFIHSCVGTQHFLALRTCPQTVPHFSLSSPGGEGRGEGPFPVSSRNCKAVMPIPHQDTAGPSLDVDQRLDYAGFRL